MAQRNLMLEKSVIRRDCFGGMLYFASFNAICLTRSLQGMNVVKFFPTAFLQSTLCLYYLAPYKTEPATSWRSEGPALGPVEREKEKTIPIPRLKKFKPSQ